MAAEFDAKMTAEFGGRPTLTQLAERTIAERDANDSEVGMGSDAQKARWAEDGLLRMWAGFTLEQVEEEVRRLRLGRAWESAAALGTLVYFNPTSEDLVARVSGALVDVRLYGTDGDVDKALNEAARRAKEAGVGASVGRAVLARSREIGAEIKRSVPGMAEEAEARVRAEIAAAETRAMLSSHGSEAPGSSASGAGAPKSRARASAGGPRRRSKANSSGGSGGDDPSEPGDDDGRLRRRGVEPLRLGELAHVAEHHNALLERLARIAYSRARRTRVREYLRRILHRWAPAPRIGARP